MTDSVLTPAGIDMLAAFGDANGSCKLAYGAYKTFTVNYTAPVANAGEVIANIVSVSAIEDDTCSIAATASASDSVTYQNVAPAIHVVKSASPTSVAEGGVGGKIGRASCRERV